MRKGGGREEGKKEGKEGREEEWKREKERKESKGHVIKNAFLISMSVDWMWSGKQSFTTLANR